MQSQTKLNSLEYDHKTQTYSIPIQLLQANDELIATIQKQGYWPQKKQENEQEVLSNLFIDVLRFNMVFQGKKIPAYCVPLEDESNRMQCLTLFRAFLGSTLTEEGAEELLTYYQQLFLTFPASIINLALQDKGLVLQNKKSNAYIQYDKEKGDLIITLHFLNPSYKKLDPLEGARGTLCEFSGNLQVILTFSKKQEEQCSVLLKTRNPYLCALIIDQSKQRNIVILNDGLDREQAFKGFRYFEQLALLNKRNAFLEDAQQPQRHVSRSIANN